MKTVLIVNALDRVPTYHQIGQGTPEQLEHGQFVAVCGKSSAPISQVRLREEHADKFARPCQRCFPGKLGVQ